jgi:hypothetical protein
VGVLRRGDNLCVFCAFGELFGQLKEFCEFLVYYEMTCNLRRG